MASRRKLDIDQKSGGPPSGAPGAKSTPVAKGAPGAKGAPFVKRGVQLRKEYIEELRRLAYWERKKMRDLIDAALKLYLEQQEPTEPIPDD